MEQKSVNSSAPNPFSASGTAATDLASHSGKAKMSCKAELRMDEPNGIVSAEVRYNSQGFWIEYYA